MKHVRVSVDYTDIPVVPIEVDTQWVGPSMIEPGFVVLNIGILSLTLSTFQAEKLLQDITRSLTETLQESTRPRKSRSVRKKLLVRV